MLSLAFGTGSSGGSPLRTKYFRKKVDAALPPTTRCVKANAAGDNNGRYWANAYTSLQSAIDASVAGDEIWVAAGTYFPSKDLNGNAAPTDPRLKLFYINKDLKVYGGFAGNESSLTNRPTP